MDDTTGRVGRADARGARERTSGRVAAEPDLPPEVHARAHEIREEIAQTREDMSETIEAIQDRLRPANLVANAGETVRAATTEKVKQMANTAQGAADQVMNSTFVETVRANPIPAAMIGIGTAWLLIKARSESNGDRYARGSRYIGGERYRGYGAGASDISGYGSAAGEVRALGDVSGEASSAAYESRMYDYRGGARRRAPAVQLDRVLQDNPLALGAAAVLVGAAIGMSIPETDAENELMGDARDTIVDRARELAGDAAQKVQDVAGKAVDTAAQVRDAAGRAAGAAGSTTARANER
jgi:Protein of unknown function (DUF3618)